MTTPARDSQRPPLLELVVAAGSLLGVVLAVLSLDIDRTMRAVGITLIALAAASALLAIVVARFRRIALGGAVGLALVAVGVLALAPPGTTSATTGPAPAGLVVSSLEVLAGGPERAAEVDVSLRNPGTSRVGLTEATVTIVDSAVIHICQFASASDLSASYDVELPDDPPSGTVLRKALHQEIGPDELDRFSLRFGLPPLETHPLDSYLYRVRISVANDAGSPPAELGEFLVEAQTALSTDHYFPAPRPATLADARDGLCGDTTECQHRVQSCWNDNRVQLERILVDGPRLSESAAKARTVLFG